MKLAGSQLSEETMENWKTIDRHTDYEVSDLGNIRRKATGKVLKPIGNVQVKLDGYQRSINHLVARHHVGPAPSPTAVVLHRDGNRRNCSASNLVWALRPRRMSWNDETRRYEMSGWTRFE